MATAKKLPSGNWRVRAYAGTDRTGKKIMVSFTAPTKREAELKAAQYLAENKTGSGPSDITVSDAIDRYITAKTAVLSASTIHGYRGLQRRYYDGIADKKVRALTTEGMQLFKSRLVHLILPVFYGLFSCPFLLFAFFTFFHILICFYINQSSG